MEFSILIVDDDKLLADKLEETVQWEKIGISMVFTAYNIRQAQNFWKNFPYSSFCVILICPRAADWNFWSGSEADRWKLSVYF